MRTLRAAIAVMAIATAMSIPATAHADDADTAPASALAAKIVTKSDVGILAASCSGGYWCIWRYTNPGSNTNRYQWSGSDGDYRNNYWGDGASVDNTPSAAWNASNQNNWVAFHAGYNYTNTSAHPYKLCFQAGTSVADLRDLGFDNSGSSHRFVSSC